MVAPLIQAVMSLAPIAAIAPAQIVVETAQAQAVIAAALAQTAVAIIPAATKAAQIPKAMLAVALLPTHRSNFMTKCETCANYIYDDEYDNYFCDINLDEDEMVRFLKSETASCPYYNPYDEYKIVRKQN